MKIHVFVDDNDNIVLTSPVTAAPNSEQTGVVFANAVPAQQGASLRCYELDTEDDSLDSNQIKDAAELYEKYAQMIKAGSCRKL
jgi:methylthioribose-1-phosphate isomerase